MKSQNNIKEGSVVPSEWRRMSGSDGMAKHSWANTLLESGAMTTTSSLRGVNWQK